FLHGLAALADGADGGIFTFSMISPFEIAWSQEIFAVAYLGLYLVGFSSMIVRRKRLEEHAAVLSGTSGLSAGTAILPELIADDRDLLELEAWYWAWRSHAEAAETDEDGDRLIDQMLGVAEKLIDSPSQSIVGVAAKLRVFQDMTKSVERFEQPEMNVEARLL